MIMFVQEMAKLMAREEGFHLSGSRAWRNNNPGNLDAGARAWGKDSAGYAMYETVSAGWADLEGLIVRVIRQYPGLTLETFFAGQRDESGTVVAGGYPGYAPAGDPRGSNSPNVYAQYVGAKLGIPITTLLAGELPATPIA